MLSVPLQDTDDPGSAKYLVDLKLSLDYYADQRVSKEGIGIALTVKNESTAEMSILNPLEMLKITLLDGSGAPINLPVATPARIKVNYAGDFDVVFPFKVKKVDRAIGGKSVHNPLDHNAEQIAFPGNSNTRFFLQIDSIQQGKADGSGGSEKMVQPPAGSYSILLTLPVISGQGEPAHRIVASQPIKIDYSGSLGCLAAIIAFFKRIFGK